MSLYPYTSISPYDFLSSVFGSGYSVFSNNPGFGFASLLGQDVKNTTEKYFGPDAFDWRVSNSDFIARLNGYDDGQTYGPPIPENFVAPGEVSTQQNSPGIPDDVFKFYQELYDDAYARAETYAENNRIFQQNSAREAMQFSAEQAALNRQWQERMSNTAYQRAMADMKAAGLNPILAYTQGGASTPGGSSASGFAASGSMANTDPDMLANLVGNYHSNTAKIVGQFGELLGSIGAILGKALFKK